VSAQIYLPQMTRNLHIEQLNEFIWPFEKRVLTQFENIEEESNEIGKQYWDNVMNQPGDEDHIPDYESLAETSQEKTNYHYYMLKLGKYTVTAAWHVTLYEFFLQQIRLFLYRENSRYEEIDLKSYGDNLKKIKTIYNEYKYQITNLSAWTKIEELRLLSNVLKHGDGASADTLRKQSPMLFLKDDDGENLFDLYNTTLLEITMNINGSTLHKYKVAIEKFWRELPERLYK
jgi:hypothetical protein